MAQGGDESEVISSPVNQEEGTIITEIPNNQPPKERISGKEVEAMPNATLAEMYKQNNNAVFLIAVLQSETTYAQGTGFFISASGIGVSNYHVFEGIMYLKVEIIKNLLLKQLIFSSV